jgi:hypothetical protein
MSEHAPGQYPLSKDELVVLNRQEEEKVEEAGKKLDELAQSMGYVSVSTFEELGLTQEQIGKFSYHSLKEKRPSIKYYIANRKDGEKVRVVALPRSDGCYFAEFFSTNSHGSNHDFSLSEMKGNLQLHLELQPTLNK